jgi:hypothetical protein
LTSLDHIRRVLAEGLTRFPLYLANEHAGQELLYPPILSSTYTTQPRFKSQNQFKNAGIQLCSPQNFEGKSLTVIFHDLIINNKSESLEYCKSVNSELFMNSLYSVRKKNNK